MSKVHLCAATYTRAAMTASMRRGLSELGLMEVDGLASLGKMGDPARIDPARVDAFYIRAVRLPRAPMAELVDASDSKSDSARSAGSIPARGTTSTSKKIPHHPRSHFLTIAFVEAMSTMVP